MPKSNYSDNRKKKRKMKKFVLTEISAVDTPAQEGAQLAIMKRFEKPEEETPNENVSKRLHLTSSNEGHVHIFDITDFEAFKKGGHTSYENDHSHPYVINDDGSITIGEVNGHTHASDINVSNFMKNQTNADGLDGDSLNGGPAMSGNQKDAAELQKSVDNLKKELEYAKAYGALSDNHKSHCDGLENDAARTEFVNKSAEDRDNIVKAAQADDPVIYKSANGVEFRKSDDPRLVQMAKQADESESRYQAEIEKRLKESFIKSANTDLNNLTGELDNKVELIAKVNEITDVNTRDAVLNILKSANTSLGELFKSKGNSFAGGNKGSAEDQLDTLAKNYAKDNNVSYAQAYAAVTSTPDGQELYAKSLAQ